MTTATAMPPRPVLYLRATRPLYLPTSVIPALAGALVAIGVAGADWWLLPVALLALLLVHAGTDVINDVEDFAHGVDTEEKMDNSRVFTTGLLSVREGRALGLALFGGAALLGGLICLIQGPWLLVYGVLGILGGYLYTAGPRPYKHVGLGDPLIIFLMGPLMTQGAYTAVTGDPFSAAAFFLGFVPGLLIAAVLQGNNASDILADGAAGVRTLAVRVGFGTARNLYIASLTLAYVAVVAIWVGDLFGPAILLPLLTLPIAAGLVRQAARAARPDDGTLATLAPKTAQLHLLASVLLVVGVILDRSL